MKKALKNLLLAAAFVVAATVIPVFTGSGTVAYAADGFVVENGELKEYNGPDGAVTVPDYVRKIGDYAFENHCPQLREKTPSVTPTACHLPQRGRRKMAPSLRGLSA